MVTDLIESSRAALQASGVSTLAEVRQQATPLMCYSDNLHQEKTVLKRFLRENLYYHPKVYRMSWRAQRIIQALFGAYMQDNRLLSPKYQNFAREYEAVDGEAGRARAIADFIAGMTDRYAMHEYGQLFDLSAM
jgi:dGTPase